MKARRTFLLYLLVLFGLGVLLLVFFLLRGMDFSRVFGQSDGPGEAFSWKVEINNANTFYKNQQYEQVGRLLAKFPMDSLKPSQRHTVHLMRASALRAQGLYRTALESAQAALGEEETPFVHFLLGLIHEGAGSPAEAQIDFQNALKKDRDFAPAREKLGDLAFRRHEMGRALSWWSKGSALGDSVSEAALLKRALGHYLSSEDGKALSLVTLYLDKSKTQRDAEIAWLLKGMSLAALDRPREADEAFQKAVGIAPMADRHIYRYLYALYLIRQKQFTPALELLAQLAWQGGERNPAAQFSLGLLYFRNENYEQSLNYLGRNRAFATDQPDLYFYAVALYKLGRLKEALATFDLIRDRLRADEYSLSATLLSSLCLARLGRVVESQSRVDEALSVWRDDPRAVYTLAVITLFQPQKDFMEKLRPWIDRKEYPQLHLLLAEYHLRANRIPQALASVLAYQQKNPPLPRLARVVGDLQARLKDFRHAEESYRDALALSPEPAEKRRLYNNLAWVQWHVIPKPDTEAMRARQREEAVNTLEDALKQEIDEPGYLYNRGILARAQGQDELYRTFMERAVAQVSRTTEARLLSRIWEERGMILIDEGRRQAAREALSRSLEADPQNATAALALRGLP